MAATQLKIILKFTVKVKNDKWTMEGLKFTDWDFFWQNYEFKRYYLIATSE